MGEIETYIGSKNVGTLEINKGNDALIMKDYMKTVEVLLNPYNSSRLGQNEVIANILPLDKDSFKDMKLWAPYILIEEDLENVPYFKISIIIQPPLAPNWRKTSIVIWGYHDKDNPRQWSYNFIMPESGNGIIPTSKSDVILPNGLKSYTFDKNNILPGEKIAIQWDLFDGLNTHIVNDLENGFTWWEAPLITGGFITEKIGEYEDIDLSFKVNIKGEDIICKPSDYSLWEVGNWVFVVKNYNIILPILVDDKGAKSDSFLVDYKIDELSKLLLTKFYTGTVTAVDKKNNIGSVELANDQGVLNDIPIFYHVPEPPNNVSIDQGGYAFKIEDEVLIHQATDMTTFQDIFTIVGFLDGLHEPERWIEYWAGNWPNWISIDYQNNLMYILDATMGGIRRLNLNTGQLDAYWQPVDSNGNRIIQWTSQYYEYHAVEFNHQTGELFIQARYIYPVGTPGDGKLYSGTFGQTIPVQNRWDGDFRLHVCRKDNRLYAYRTDGVVFNHSLTDFIGDYETTFRHPWDPQIPIPGNCDFFTHDCSEGGFYFAQEHGANSKTHLFKWYWINEFIEDWELDDLYFFWGFDVSPINHNLYYKNDITESDEIYFRTWMGEEQVLKFPKNAHFLKLIHDENYFWFVTGSYVIQTTLEYLQS